MPGQISFYPLFFASLPILLVMEDIYDKYQLVVGLEVHAQLVTKSKAYSADSAEYGGMPNIHVSPTSFAGCIACNECPNPQLCHYPGFGA